MTALIISHGPLENKFLQKTFLNFLKEKSEACIIRLASYAIILPMFLVILDIGLKKAAHVLCELLLCSYKTLCYILYLFIGCLVLVQVS